MASISISRLRTKKSSLYTTSRRLRNRTHCSEMMKSCCAIVLITCIASAYSLAPPICKSSRSISSFSIALNARGNGATLETRDVHQAKPRKLTSSERKRAVEAMMRKKVPSVPADTIVDENILEMMFRDTGAIGENPSDTQLIGRKKPYGRPKSVAGAMGYQTMLDYREREERAEEVYAKINSSTYTPLAIMPIIHSPGTAPTKPITGSPSRIMHSELSSVATGKTEARTTSKKEKHAKMKKVNTKVAKFERTKSDGVKRRGKYHKTEGLKQYYETELLTAKEEYSLGTKIQFMIKCDSVHEGLSIGLQRLPTIQEWSEACGFTETDSDFFERLSHMELRPLGSEEMFTVKNPNMFVGNGLASQLGVGRGHGRAKKPPPVGLNKFFDDTENKFRPKGSSRIPKVLLNTGTPSDFVDIIMDAKVAKQRMVSSNMRLVLSISRKYSNVGVNLLDLVQEGSLGLSRAAEKFEPKKGFKFSTYASWWIQQAVFRAIAYHSRTIRLPVHVHNLLNRIRKIRKNLEQELGRHPTNEEMAKQLDMPVEKYNKMMKLTRQSISLETPKFKQSPKDNGVESREHTLKDSVTTKQVFPEEITAEIGVDRSLFHEDLKDMLKMLEEDERRVITARYGLDDGLGRTVTTVAAQMKMSKTWVRSQECRALRKLRRPWYEKRLKEHQNSLQR